MNDHDFGLWGETAEPGMMTLSLPGDCDCDVVVIGAGYTGLSTALHLAKQGIGVMCIDRESPGFGASGRNGGQVLSGFKIYPDHLKAEYGSERGEAMTEFGAGLGDDLFALIDEHKIKCDAKQSGWVHAGHHMSKLAEQRWKHDQWASRGAKVRWLDKASISAHLGTDAYVGGWLDERGGTVQPLSLVRGLAQAAAALGARIYSSTLAGEIAQDGDGWRVMTNKGKIRARHVVLATNAYTGDMVKGLAGTMVPVESAQIATEPLPEDLLKQVLPTLSCVSDTRRSLLYFRRSSDGRLVIGGRGGILQKTDDAHFDRLFRATHILYPALKDIRFSHRWAGRLAVTMDHMPHLHEPKPGLIASVGCNGRGVAYSTAMGKLIAQRISTGSWEGLPMPVTPIKPMPFAPFRRFGAAFVAGWYGWRDRRQGVL